MYPIALDLSRIPILLVGSGELLARRRTWLEEAGAAQLLIKENASAQDIENATIVMVAGLPREQAEAVVNICRAARKLVNVEDINELCDFYFTANIKRGDLIIAVSTSGASPTLARKIRDRIGELFGDIWGARTAEIKRLRLQWKNDGKDVIAHSEAHIARWLKDEAA